MVAAGAIPAVADATEHNCGIVGVSANAASHEDAALACGGAQDAIAFLVSLGLRAPAVIPVDVVPRLFDGVRPTMAGHFRESDRRVQVLSYGEFSRHRTWFGLSIDQTLYRSLVAHEVAHAVAAHNFTVPKPSIQAKEYIAYVAMLATMPSGAREKVLAHFPGQGFAGEWQMDVAIYLADPMLFGVRAYRHFLALADARAYLQAILTGKILNG